MSGEKRAHIHTPHTLGEALADAVVTGMGSWRFIIIQTALVMLWMSANAWLLTRPFDPFPFILLNLAFSTQAAYASPLILMSQNRASTRDRARDDHEAAEVDALMTLNEQQLEILRLLHSLVEELHHSTSGPKGDTACN